jgi:hypothetical protein
MKLQYIILFITVFLCFNASTQTPVPDLTGLRAIGSPANPKVKMQWDRYHDYTQIVAFCKEMAQKHPQLVKTESIGKSFEGRDIYVLKITDYQTGNPERKPAMYIDGNIHANELQCTEMSMYTAWYLAENFEYVDFIKELLHDKIFYILPTISPDSRDYFIYKPNHASSSRTGMMPIDYDGDGLINEDTFDDLDGDGNIVMMRRKSPTGRWIQDPKFPLRMVRAEPNEPGEYEMLGFEGFDNDGDGLVNEDGPGYYDPNRDWGWGWQPDYIQGGALYYPGTLPETKAVKNFVMAHPNIAGAQSYHNYGGMFLRGPGAEEDSKFYNRQDVAVYDVIGKLGERIIPGYNYFTIHKDLYTVYGGEIDWFALGRGIFTFSNELMTSYKLFNEKLTGQSRWESTEFHEFDKYLLFGDAYVQWKEYDHPQFGKIEIGGPKKNYVRNHPGFLLLEESHRNMAFTLFHAHSMPKLEIIDIKTEELGKKLTEITVTVMNHRIIPTHSAHDVKYQIERPDFIRLKNANVLSGMIVENEDFNITSEKKHEPQELSVPNINGMSAVKVRWIVKGKFNDAEVEVDSAKGGLVSKKLGN